MEAYIERVPVESERKVCKVLRVCEKYQLKEKGELSLFVASLRRDVVSLVASLRRVVVSLCSLPKRGW